MVKLNKIYTRTGDDGTTGLVDGSRLPKYAARMRAVGDVDEANSALGLAVLAMGDCAEAAWAQTIQNDLFDLGADLATPVPEGEDEPWALRIVASQVERLEAQIDAMNARLAPLDSFILPGGSAAAAPRPPPPPHPRPPPPPPGRRRRGLRSTRRRSLTSTACPTGCSCWPDA